MSQAGRAAGQLALLVLAVVLGMAPWFSATVVAPALGRQWGESSGALVWLTLGVQFGFVVGSVVSATFLLADRWRPARLAMWSSWLAAAATAALVVPGISAGHAILLRIVVGAALAGVYPPAIKVAAGWTQRRRGTAIGALVGGTTLGSALPHLLRLVVDADAWRVVLLLAAASAAIGGCLFGWVVREGPFQSPSAPFDPRALREIVRNRGVRLATLGYLGHMWELYAMWSTIGIFWGVAVQVHLLDARVGALLAFLSIGAGAVGCIVAGSAADMFGRSTITIVAMALSGACALVIGPALYLSLPLLITLSILWGITIVADSAQFSAAVTEFSDARFIGTAVTVQTALGFLLTMVTIRLVPLWSDWWGWERAYVPLAIGPAIGIAAMWRVRSLERIRLRGGS